MQCRVRNHQHGVGMMAHHMMVKKADGKASRDNEQQCVPGYTGLCVEGCGVKTRVCIEGKCSLSLSLTIVRSPTSSLASWGVVGMMTDSVTR